MRAASAIRNACAARPSLAARQSHSIREDSCGGTDRTCMCRKRECSRVWIIGEAANSPPGMDHSSNVQPGLVWRLPNGWSRIVASPNLPPGAPTSGCSRGYSCVDTRPAKVDAGSVQMRRVPQPLGASCLRDLAVSPREVAQASGCPAEWRRCSMESCPRECCSAGAAWGASDIGSTTLAPCAWQRAGAGRDRSGVEDGHLNDGVYRVRRE